MALLFAIAGCAPAARGAGRVTSPPAVADLRAPKQSPAGVVVGRARTGTEAEGLAAAAAEPELILVEAIAALEAFIAAHPDDRRYVPDALLRLGALQLDGAEAALDRGEEVAFARATTAAVTALARLVEGHPGYGRRDVALYLLGFARQQAGDAAGALAAYGAVAAMPTSAHADEARLRVGELHFDGGAFELAAAAYAAVVARPDSRFLAIARYKLGWSHYRRDAYPAAIAAFQALLDMNDAEPGVADLRAEAAQYLAQCLIEPDWDGDRIDDRPPPGAATASVARVAAHLGHGASPSRRVVTERAAEALADELRVTEAAAVHHLLLAVTTDGPARARIEAALGRLAGHAP